MSLHTFLYRQKQRIIYHLTDDTTRRLIADINRFQERIIGTKEGYFLKDVNLHLPKTGFEFVFQSDTFELLVGLQKDLSGQYILDNSRLYLQFDDLSIEVTSKSELFIVNEIFVHRCYNFFLPYGEVVNVIDVGMNVGLAALFFSGLPGVKNVFGLEPFPTTYRQALNNLGRNVGRKEKVQAFNVGLGGAEAEIAAAYDPRDKGINRTHDSMALYKELTSEIIVIKRASDFVRALMDKYTSMKFILKIDAEGAEYAIFDSLFKEGLPARIKGFIVEWHFQGPQKLEEALLMNGFLLTSVRLTKNSGLVYAFR